VIHRRSIPYSTSLLRQSPKSLPHPLVHLEGTNEAARHSLRVSISRQSISSPARVMARAVGLSFADSHVG
jgi:hypothetical protein